MQNIFPQINTFLLLLPGVILLITIIIAVYFTTAKSQYKSAVKQTNREYLVELVKIQKELNLEISKLIYEGSQNLNRALELWNENYTTTDYIIDYRISQFCPYIKEVTKTGVIWGSLYSGSNNADHFPRGFEEILEIDKLFEIFEKAKQLGNYYDLHNTNLLNRDARYLFNLSLLNRKTLNIIMFTESGIKALIESSNKNNIYYDDLQNGKHKEDLTYYESIILIERQQFKKNIEEYLFEGIELLLTMKKYNQAIDKSINF